MRRTRIELDDVAGFANLAEASRRAARGKRSRSDVRAFFERWEHSLAELGQAVLDGRAPRGEYREFAIRDPKPRIIHAACFEDRVLHHAVMIPAGPVLERAMTDTSYACRPGKGTLAAVRQVQAHLRSHPWYVKVDISGYFRHIDHQVLFDLLQRRFKGDGFLNLLWRIIDGFATEPGKGLPIGSLTSQYFANHYLDGLDRLLLERLGVRAEIRYMDDVIWWCDSREQAKETLAQVGDWLERERLLQLKVHPQINRCAHGVSFGGYRILRGALRLGRRRRRSYQARRAHWEQAWADGRLDDIALQRAYDAVLATTVHADSRSWRRAELQRRPATEV